MSEILCVTNRALCNGDFFGRIRQIAEAKPAGIILREKDLSETEYKKLAYRVLALCQENRTLCILHNFVSAAKDLNCRALHLPMHILSTLCEEERKYFTILGASCHSVEEAVRAEHLGCTYITAGHIFATDCKRGLPGRGLAFLREVCENVSIPVYAIGGITAENADEVKTCGAYGVCAMSGAMQCSDVRNYFSAFHG